MWTNGTTEQKRASVSSSRGEKKKFWTPPPPPYHKKIPPLIAKKTLAKSAVPISAYIWQAERAGGEVAKMERKWRCA